MPLYVRLRFYFSVMKNWKLQPHSLSVYLSDLISYILEITKELQFPPKPKELDKTC